MRPERLGRARGRMFADFQATRMARDALHIQHPCLPHVNMQSWTLTGWNTRP